MRKHLVWLAIGLASQGALTGSGHAAVVTRCVAPVGYTYFFAGGAVPAKSAGMQSDAISAGQYLLMQDADGAYDVVFSDATGRTVSSKDDGGTILLLASSQRSIVILVNYPDMLIETWLFNIDKTGTGVLTLSQARYGETAPVRKHALMSANCRR